MFGFSAHGIIDNLQLEFPEIGRGAGHPGERSEQKAAVAATDHAATNHANPSRGQCFEQTAAIATTNHANPSPGQCSGQTAAVAATNHANPNPGVRSEQKAAAANPVS